MNKKRPESANLPKPLNRVKKLFNRWRQTHQPRARFSEELWSAAVSVARKYGHSRTAGALGLDYYSLKKRLAGTPVTNNENRKDTSPFIELIPPVQGECIIEFEEGEDRKMRISLKGRDIPDLVSLSRSFWSPVACSK